LHQNQRSFQAVFADDFDQVERNVNEFDAFARLVSQRFGIHHERGSGVNFRRELRFAFGGCLHFSVRSSVALLNGPASLDVGDAMALLNPHYLIRGSWEERHPSKLRGTGGGLKMRLCAGDKRWLIR
jgi:hypothetical protein